MSWDSYLDAHVVSSGLVDQAFLIDLSGRAIWGKSQGVEPSDEDRTKIASAFQDNSKAFEEGITLNGTRYTITEIRETPVEEKNISILHAAQKKQGVIAAKCAQSILVAHYPESVSQRNNSISFIAMQAAHLMKNNL